MTNELDVAVVVLVFAVGVVIGLLVGIGWRRSLFPRGTLPPPEAPIAPAPKGNIVPLARIGRRP